MKDSIDFLDFLGRHRVVGHIVAASVGLILGIMVAWVVFP